MMGRHGMFAFHSLQHYVGCRQSLAAVVALGTLVVSCSGSESPSSSASGGASVFGGGSSAGGASSVTSGGSASTGGKTSAVATSSTGGSAAPGGAPNTGGTNAVAGTGGASPTGGISGTGAAVSTGGSKTSGGSSAIGGNSATGGSKQAGGVANTGGSPTTGGSKQTGGMANTGGSAATGGSKSTGGSLASGGSNAAGGGTGTGGSAGTDMCGRSTALTVPSGYTKLTWHDEFDVDGTPTAGNWGYETGFVRNNELQWYQAKNAAVAGGLLHITGKRERVTNPNYNASGADWKTTRQYADYTSASMTTSGKQSWKFGRFLMCGKIPISSGMWPAWWTLGVSGEWPSNGEIDIMEFYKGKILANVASGTSTRWVARWFSATKAVDATWAASYHLWRMDWDTNNIKLYVDDALLNSVSLADAVNSDGSSPFRQNAYMIVNLAIGGDNGGDPASTTFPQEYLIDYVRVFQ